MAMAFEEIKNLPVIKKLKKHNEYYEHFKNLVNFYAERLNSGALVREIGFTPHDFSHHCKDIYKILGTILPPAFYKKYCNGSNLFLLLVAVLLHDIAMSEDVSEEARRCHSKRGQKYILNALFGSEDNPLKIHCDRDFADALGDVVYAHSDIKGENGEIINYTCREILEKYKESSSLITVGDEELNIPFIAALLRLADELDISYDRIKNTGYESKKNSEESKQHYVICEYFKQIQNHSDRPKELSIEVYETAFEKLDEQKKAGVAGQIISKYIKIKTEFEFLYKEILSSTKFASDGIWIIEKIQLKDEEKYRDYVKKKE